MSGGHFDYRQYRIRDIADTLKEDMEGRELDKEDLEQLECEYKRGWITNEFYQYCMEHKHTPPCDGWSSETVKMFKQGYKLLRLAEIYAQRIDWLMSGDDGEEAFHERLREDIEKLRKELKEEKL